MSHFVVLLYLLSLGSGIAAISLLAFIFSRTREAAIRAYLPFLAIYTMLICALTVLNYVAANGLVRLEGPDSLFALLKIYLAVFVPFLGAAGLVMPRFYAAFLDLSLPQRYRASTIVLAAAAAPVFAILVSRVHFFAGLAAFLVYVIGFITASSYLAVRVARRRPFVRDPMVRAAIAVLSMAFGLSIGGAIAESFLMTRLYVETGGKAVFFSIVNPLFYLLWNVLSIFFAAKRYLHPVAPGSGLELSPRFLEQFGITDREAEITRAVLEGQSNKEIAYNLSISINTVRNHLSSVFMKAGVASRMQLAKRLRTAG